MSTIKFADGVVYECAYLSTGPLGLEETNTAFIALSGVTFAEAAVIFSDTEKTSEMEWGNYRLIGYTNLVGMSMQPYGPQAILKGGHDERRN